MQRFCSQQNNKLRRSERYHVSPLLIPQLRIRCFDAGDKAQHDPPAHEFVGLDEGQATPIDSREPEGQRSFSDMSHNESIPPDKPFV
jgi:hypothetical protein